MWQQGVFSETLWLLQVWPLTKHRTPTEFLQLRKWLLSSVQTLHRFQLHDILIGSNAFVQRATTEHNLDQLNADALKHCLVSLKPRANLTHLAVCAFNTVTKTLDMYKQRWDSNKVISAVEKKCKCHIGILGKDAKKWTSSHYCQTSPPAENPINDWERYRGSDSFDNVALSQYLRLVLSEL